jgi:SAM-dependent methyltransferase
VLDVACGAGRHVHWFAQRDCRVTAVDRDAQALEPLRVVAEVQMADLERGPWPLPGRRFDAVVVTHYLWRALWPALLESIAPQGWLLYETFAAGQQSVGRPSNADFLLRPGELLDVVRGSLRVVAYEDGFLESPDRFIQRIAAVREVPSAQPGRYPL